VTGFIAAAVARRGQATTLSNVVCTLGRYDKPYPEAHEAEVWTIALVRRGAFRYRAAATNRAHPLRAGWLLVGRPDDAFECSHDHDGGDDCTSLAIGQDALHAVAGAAGVSMQRLLSAPPALPPLPRVAALLERARLRDDADLDEVGYLIAESVVAHAAGTPPVEVSHHPSHAGRMGDAMALIERSCRQALSLSDVARSVGLSPFHFLRVFRRVTGTTPHQYLIGARIRLATRLLLDTDRRVTEIAYDAGFQDLSNFVRTFHRVVGCSPRAYRSRCPVGPRPHRFRCPAAPRSQGSGQ
jgi:AraC-like DNA-binding protein